MPRLISDANRSTGMRFMVALVALASSISLYFAMSSTASANEPLCGVYLQPYGQPGDRCYGAGHPLFGVTMVTYERAGCVDVANSNNELLLAWKCAAAGSAPGPAAELHFANDGVRRKGVIRNNNLSFKGYFSGTVACYYEC